MLRWEGIVGRVMCVIEVRDLVPSITPYRPDD